MKILVKLELSLETEVDLTEFGYDESQKWDELTEEQKNEILDPMRETAIPNVYVELIDDEELDGKIVTDFCNDHTPYRGVCSTCGRY